MMFESLTAPFAGHPWFVDSSIDRESGGRSRETKDQQKARHDQRKKRKATGTRKQAVREAFLAGRQAGQRRTELSLCSGSRVEAW